MSNEKRPAKGPGDAFPSSAHAWEPGSQRREDRDQPSGAVDETFASIQIQIERKTFEFKLKENAQGRFLRITEMTNGRKSAIVIPASGLREFELAVSKLAALNQAGVSEASEAH